MRDTDLEWTKNPESDLIQALDQVSAKVSYVAEQILKMP